MNNASHLAPRKYDSVYWVEIDKVHPNPYQPRKEFDELALQSLAESIRQYGILQPLVVTRKEIEKEDGGLTVQYELIAGERRLRASKLIGLREVPVVIRTSEDDGQMKLELAIIENLQREDLNAIDRARALQQLAEKFKLTHEQIGEKIGKSRVYVTNSIRLLMLPEHIQESVRAREISEGHARPLLMLIDRKEEQETLFKEILTRKISVRDTEQLARRIAVERTRKNDLSPEMQHLEKELATALGTRVYIERKKEGGKVVIDFFTDEDLASIRDYLSQKRDVSDTDTTERVEEKPKNISYPDFSIPQEETVENLYDIKNFSL